MNRDQVKSRGGQAEFEVLHGQQLLQAGAEEIWGWGTPAGRERVGARIRWIVETCTLGPGVRVLECGCGTGVFTRGLAETGATITAVDISQELLGEARRKCTAANVTFVQANLEAPDALPDGGYDVLCGVSVLHHLDLDKTLPALRTKLKPTGVFAFSEPNLANPINKYLLFTDNLEKRKKHGLSPGEQAFYAGELFEIFRKAGFHVRSLRHRDFMHPSVPRFLIPAWSVVQSLAERLPLVRTWSGSLWIHGTRGSS